MYTVLNVQDKGLANILKNHMSKDMGYVGFLNRHNGSFYLVKDIKNYYNISTKQALQLREENLKNLFNKKREHH